MARDLPENSQVYVRVESQECRPNDRATLFSVSPVAAVDCVRCLQQGLRERATLRR